MTADIVKANEFSFFKTSNVRLEIFLDINDSLLRLENLSLLYNAAE